MVRVKLPNSAIEGPVTFQIYVVNQEPSTPIAKWITGLHGNGVVYQSGGAFAVSIDGEDESKLDIEKGFALIDNLETYYGAAQQYSVAALGDGTYKLYLTSVGVISAIIDTSSIPANSIELSRVVVNTNVATGVTDKRLFLTNVMVGLDAAKTATPTKNQVYIATDTTKLYICFVDDSWTQVIPYPNMVTKTGDFTAGKIVKINNASGIIEMATNTDAEVADAVSKSHLGDLLSTTTVDFDANADTVLYTVPTGKRCVLTYAIVVAAADAGSTYLSIGQNGAETDFHANQGLDSLDAQYDALILRPVDAAKIKSYEAATVIEAKVTYQSGAAGNTVYLFGILY